MLAEIVTGRGDSLDKHRCANNLGDLTSMVHGFSYNIFALEKLLGLCKQASSILLYVTPKVNASLV